MYFYSEGSARSADSFQKIIDDAAQGRQVLKIILYKVGSVQEAKSKIQNISIIGLYFKSNKTFIYSFIYHLFQLHL